MFKIMQVTNQLKVNDHVNKLVEFIELEIVILKATRTDQILVRLKMHVHILKKLNIEAFH